MKANFPKEDRAFMEIDMGTAVDIARLLMRIPEKARRQALALFLWYKYADFDLDKPFLEQYRRNTAKLLAAIRQLVKETEGAL